VTLSSIIDAANVRRGLAGLIIGVFLCGGVTGCAEGIQRTLLSI
jgi:hypothetical protein